MTRIVGVLKMFDLNQTFYVYEDGQEVDIVKGKIEDIPNIIFSLSNKYNTNEISLSGVQGYTEGIVQRVKEQELTKYNKNI